MSSRNPRASGYFRTGYAQEIALTQTRTERVALVALLLALAPIRWPHPPFTSISPARCFSRPSARCR